MCKADIALPKHLRGNAGACMAVALQALEWQMSPFAAQLIAAVVNTRSGIEGRLKYRFEGDGDAMKCFVIGKIDGEELDYESPAIGSIHPKNSPLWKTNPQQQLGYYSARAWARRHTPEVILGVYDREEAETFQGPDNAKDVTPSLTERLALAKQTPREGQQAREGFDADFVRSETAALSGVDEIEQETSADAPPAGEGTSELAQAQLGGANPSADPACQNPGAAAPEAGDIGAQAEPDASSASVTLSAEDRAFLVRVFKALAAAVGPDVEILKRQAIVFKDEIAGKSALVKAKASTIRTKLEECCGDEPRIGTITAGKYLAGLIGIDEKELV
jgi:hypothetical protein